MKKNEIIITIVIGLIMTAVLAGTAGWSLGKGSISNTIKEKPINSTDSASATGLFSGERPKDFITLKVATPTSFHSGQDVIAQKYGFFEKEGIKIEYVGALSNPAEQIAALSSGQIDVLISNQATWIPAFKAGVKFKGVARTMLGHPSYPHMTFFVRNDSPIKEPKDLIGKKVAPGEIKGSTFDSGCGGYYWTLYLKKYGIPRDALIQVPMPEPQQEQALREGLIDVSANGPTFAANYLKKGGLRPLFNSWEFGGEDSEFSMIGFSEEFIRKNPEAVRRFVSASIKAAAWTIDHHKISSEYVGALQGFEPNINAEHHYSATGLIEDKPLQQWIDYYVDIGFMKPGEIKPSDMYTNEFNPYNEYQVNDPVKNPTFYDTFQLEWANKRNASLKT